MEKNESINLLMKLRRNSSLSKYAHFFAAERTKAQHIWVGVPALLINLTLGSVFFFYLTYELPTFTKWIGAFLALSAASLGAIQTYYSFNKIHDGHRKLANKYLKIESDCEIILSQYQDELIQMKDVLVEIKKLK